jgi:hypothetical protein
MSTYRDERDAAHAQNAALQQEKATLEKEVGELRTENESLRRENESLRSAAGLPTPRKSRVALFTALALVVFALMGAGAWFATVRTVSSPPIAPSVVPVSAPAPSVPTPTEPTEPTQLAPAPPT